MKKLSLLMAGTAILGVLAPVATYAQETEDGARQNTSGVSTIVVTANRREESLQDVPIAVTALGSEQLKQANIVSLQDVAQLAPGLEILPAFVPGNAIFQIRGQVQTDTNPTIDASVGVYFDDVYIARSAGSLTNLLDVSRVEVLKGPQGTLFGRNTTGGAIRIISNRPTDEFEGYARIGYQSYDQFNLEGVINIPLAEGAAFRAAAQYIDKSDGAFTNGITGDPIDTNQTFFGRGSLLLNPTDRFELLIQGDYTDVDAGGVPQYLKDYVLGNSVVSALNNGFRLGFTDPGAAIGAGNAALLAEIAMREADPRTLFADVRAVTADSITYTPGVNGGPPTLSYVGGEINPYNRYEAYGGAINASYNFDFGTLRSITSLRRVDYDSAYNLDGLGINYINKSRGMVQSEQFSQELILSGEAFDDRLQWSVGGIYFNENTLQEDASFGLIYLTAPAGALGSTTISDSANESWGVFAQGTFAVTDEFSVTAGVRRSHDKRGFVASSVTNLLNGATVCNYNAANGLSTLPIFSAPCNLSQNDSFNQWSYTASLNYEFGPSQLVYVRTGRGYRSGGFNGRVSVPEVLGSFRPEVVTDYEIGLKADWLDRLLRTNIAAFISRSSDTQLTLNGTSGTTVFTRTSNIGVREVRGVELEIAAAPSDFVSFDASVAYTDGDVNNPAEPDVTFLNDTPKWTLNAGATFNTPIGDSFEATLRLGASYRDKMLSANILRGAAPAGSPAGTLGPIIYIPTYRDRTLLNARLMLEHTDSGVEVAVFGTNLTNELYEARSIAIGGLGTANATYGEPRVFGVELTVPFGAMAGR